MNPFTLDRRTHAPDRPASARAEAPATAFEEIAAWRDAYLDKLTDPANGYSLETAFPLPSDLPALYAQLTELKQCLDSFRPLDSAQLARLEESFDVDYTYNSNRIEGNILTFVETDLVVNKGITIGGKPMRDHTEAINHHEAIFFIRDLAARNVDITPTTLKQIHGLILHGIDRTNAGVYRKVSVTVGKHVPPPAFLIERRMEELFEFYEANKATLHPVELAAQFHEKFETIHPFIDGNGRSGRLVMNLILIRAGYPITVIEGDDAPRTEYYRALAAANAPGSTDNLALQAFIARNVRRWLLRYLDLVSVDVSIAGKSKGAYFFRAIAPSLAASRLAPRSA
jgi:Fic family protein